MPAHRPWNRSSLECFVEWGWTNLKCWEDEIWLRRMWRIRSEFEGRTWPRPPRTPWGPSWGQSSKFISNLKSLFRLDTFDQFLNYPSKIACFTNLKKFTNWAWALMSHFTVQRLDQFQIIFLNFLALFVKLNNL